MRIQNTVGTARLEQVVTLAALVMFAAGCGQAEIAAPGGGDGGSDASAAGDVGGSGDGGGSADVGLDTGAGDVTGDDAGADDASSDAVAGDAVAGDASSDAVASDAVASDAAADAGSSDAIADDVASDALPADVAADGGADAEPPPQDCIAKSDCTGGLTCQLGDCGDKGVCVAAPDGCGAVYAPECGCDGKTYSNGCMRLIAGVGKASDGECPSGPKACKTGKEGDCGSAAFCQAPGCGDGLDGTCVGTGGGCTKEYAPVCGCDGVTYGNACMAAAAGRNIASKGACEKLPKTCGGFIGKTCDAGEVCDPDSCGADVTGLCVPAPKNPCPKTTADAQQCGCDGVTYGNACLRLIVGVAKASDGPCPAKTCTIGSSECPGDQWCVPGGKGICSGEGECGPKPQICTADAPGACGCDGQTYSNACVANSKGVAVEYDGPCKPVSGGCTVGDNSGCPKDQFCAGPCGGQGSCANKPQACTMQYDPVCGCDGKTYGNGCSAASAGVAVKSKGPCTSS